MTEGEFQKQLKKYHETGEMPVELAVKLLSECTTECVYEDETEEAKFMAIKALEQEPCEDAVSRQAELDGLASIAKAKAKSDAQKSLMGRVMFFVEQLPPVTPQPKMGHWIKIQKTQKGCHDCTIITYEYHCSECDSINVSPYKKYCPNCGCAMEGRAEE